MIRVAVIDSGVNRAHQHICARTDSVALWPDEPGATLDDRLGHGTAVMAAIQEKAPAAHYFAVKLFESSLRSSSTRLLESLDWVLKNDIDVVNLSLGTSEYYRAAELERVTGNLSKRGTFVVSARRSGDRLMMPGCFENVVGVELDWNLPRSRYRVTNIGKQPFFWASGFPRTLPGVSPARNLHGISFAVANMTGFVVRALQAFPGARSLTTLSGVLSNEMSGVLSNEIEQWQESE